MQSTPSERLLISGILGTFPPEVGSLTCPPLLSHLSSADLPLFRPESSVFPPHFRPLSLRDLHLRARFSVTSRLALRRIPAACLPLFPRYPRLICPSFPTSPPFYLEKNLFDSTPSWPVPLTLGAIPDWCVTDVPILDSDWPSERDK
jgi:hypothetical protein